MVCPLPAPSPRPPPNLLLYISAVTLLYLCNKEFSGFRSISLRSWCSGTWSVLHPLIPAHRALQTCVRTAGGGGRHTFWMAGMVPGTPRALTGSPGPWGPFQLGMPLSPGGCRLLGQACHLGLLAGTLDELARGWGWPGEESRVPAGWPKVSASPPQKSQE